MKKKTAAVAALATCIALTATFTGCSLVSSDNKKDMEQVIVEVDVSRSDKFPAGLETYKDAITTTSIVKRDLVSYFLNVGYSYIQNGRPYKETFNLLIDQLVENAVLTQYCTLELLSAKAENSDDKALETYLAFNTEVEKYEYLLDSKNVGTKDVEYSDDVLLAQYSLYTSLNSAIDNYEKTIIDEEDEYTGSVTRTTPKNVNTEQDDYYPHAENGGLDYYVYTGYNTLADCGTYKDDALDGTTRLTRLRAYNRFIKNLRNNYLVDEKEDLTDIMSLNYIQNEYLTQLKSRAVTKYFNDYEENLEEKLKDEDGVSSYLQNVYTELVIQQTRDYDTASDFESVLGNMSSDSFILYSPDTTDSDQFDGTHNGSYGFVYNILLPFNATQSLELKELNEIFSKDDNKDKYYEGRNNILKNIQTVDQRSAWFNGATKYAFDAKEAGLTDYYTTDKNSDWLFFEDNLTDSGEGGRYEKLQAYTGSYPYNGRVYENEDGSYTLLGNKLNIDGMLAEFSSYINYVLDGSKVTFDGGYSPVSGNGAYYNTDKFHKADDEDEIDYSKFVYASGKVDLGTFNKADLMKEGTDQYKAMSAVNELQFAYTTDTGVLSNYIGYSVSAYDTSYIKEFEYAAKLAISKGEGGFAVCAGDYGWHLIYVTYAFKTEGGAVYEPDWTRVGEEGTFENLFFEMIKSTNLAKVSSTLRSSIISDFNKETSVTKYQSRYQDLLDLDD